MKSIVAGIFLAMVSLVLCGQGRPVWLDDDFRKMKFPENEYITGFAYGVVADGKSFQEVARQLKTEAEADLSKKIIARVSTQSVNDITAVSDNGQYRESESFTVRSTTESVTELTGVTTESYYDERTKTIYAFAAAKRDDLAAYYKGSLTLCVSRTENLLQTAQDLEATGEKVKARRLCEEAKTWLAKIRADQEILTAIAPNSLPEDLQQAETESLQGRWAIIQARLAQAVYVYVESNEKNFTQPATVLTNQVKSALAQKGCSFVDDAQQADFCLYLVATTRHYNTDRGFVTCYADVKIALTDTRLKKSVFQDEFSQKGVTAQQETAGRKALEDAAPVIVDKISAWIQ